MGSIPAGVVALLIAWPEVALATTVEDQVLRLVNRHREKAGCEPLVAEARLTAAAEGHSRAMAAQDFVAHDGKDGKDLAARVEDQGYRWQSVGENIAAGQATAAQAVNSWMRSKGHRANILNCAFTQTGIAMVFQAGDQPLRGNPGAFSYYWTQDFARPAE